jgi:hypothetical protein
VSNHAKNVISRIVCGALALAALVVGAIAVATDAQVGAWSGILTSATLAAMTGFRAAGWLKDGRQETTGAGR